MLCERLHAAAERPQRILVFLLLTLTALIFLTSFLVSLEPASVFTTQNLIRCREQRADLARVTSAIESLQRWYDADTGLWNTTGWWNCANALTTLLNFAEEDPSSPLKEIIVNVTSNTFTKAQHAMVPRNVKQTTSGSVRNVPVTQGPAYVQAPGFLNEYYDDEGWWALAWLRAYDLTGNKSYLDMTVSIFEDLKGGWGAPCGGLWWDKSHTYKGAIENELFFAVAAGLANRVSTNLKDYYQNWALQAWDWFEHSGLINKHGLVNNGLNLSTCLNDNGVVWTYNQGVLLGGLVELSEALKVPTYMIKARKFAVISVQLLSDRERILHEVCEPKCGQDGPQFKGIFMRNILLVFKQSGDKRLSKFLEINADSIWMNDRSKDDYLGLLWSGPYLGANASTQSSALDALVGAFSVRQEKRGYKASQYRHVHKETGRHIGNKWKSINK